MNAHVCWGRRAAFLLAALSPADLACAAPPAAPSELMVTLKGHRGTVGALAFSPDGKLLASASGAIDGAVHLWDVASSKSVATFEDPWSKADVRSSSGGVAFTPDGKTLATAHGASGYTAIRLWDVATRKPRGPLALSTGPEDQIAEYNCLAISPGGRTLAAGNQDGNIDLWDLRTRRKSGRLRGPERVSDGISSVAFSPEGKRLVAGSADVARTIRLWDLTTRQCIATMRENKEGASMAVAFSPDGKALASCCNRENVVRLWDVRSRKNTATLRAGDRAVLSVAFSPDGKMLASGGGDCTVTLWDVAARKKAASLRGHKNSVTAVAFSPDGKTLASGSADTAIKVWRVPTARQLGK